MFLRILHTAEHIFNTLLCLHIVLYLKIHNLFHICPIAMGGFFTEDLLIGPVYGKVFGIFLNAKKSFVKHC